MDDTITHIEMSPIAPLMILGFAAIYVIPFWFILSKAGYSKWLSLLMFFPIVNFILLYFLAFSNWPILRNKNNIPK